MKKYKNIKIKYKRLFLILFLPLGLLLFNFGANNKAFIEKYYSSGLYKFIISIISFITGFIPFSLAEILLYLLVIFTMLSIAYLLYRIIKNINKWHIMLINYIITIAVIISIGYFTFVMVWGLNYHRLPFAEIMNWDTSPTPIEELEEVCYDLLVKTNTLRDQVKEDKNGNMIFIDGKRSVLKNTSIGYDNINNKIFNGFYGNAKGIIASDTLSYTGIWGIYIPFTGEPNVNMLIPDSMFSTSVAHEMAHQRGFAREDEANFIGYYACYNHNDVSYQYTGVFTALRTAMNSLYKSDADKYYAIREKYSDGVNRDMKQVNDYIRKYESKANEVHDKINDTYLKANNQKDGVKSYGRMVDLLIAEFRNNKKSIN